MRILVTKAFAGERRGGKYKRRVAKPGGGYRYVYDDITGEHKTKLHSEYQSLAEKAKKLTKAAITNGTEEAYRAAEKAHREAASKVKEASKVIESARDGLRKRWAKARTEKEWERIEKQIDLLKGIRKRNVEKFWKHKQKADRLAKRARRVA